MILLILFAGCQHSIDQKQLSGKQEYPILIEGGKKRVEQRGRNGENGLEVYLDTITLSKREIYRNEGELHPLTPFYLSYEEWKTIECIISIDENDYWDKAMIGLIQKSGTLRIKHKNQDIILNSFKANPIKEGIWTNTYSNDSIEIKLSTNFEDNRIARRFTGLGNLQGRIGKVHFIEGAFFVYSKD